MQSQESIISLIRHIKNSKVVQFIALNALDTTQAHIYFPGNFQAESVLWDARIVALGKVEQHNNPQFVEVSTTGVPLLMQISLGLHLEKINVPAVLKTIHMIRNYKALHLGRHSWK